jgi:uncharacterized membrane protein (DUF485 family)
MKQATQLAFYGTLVLIIVRLLFILPSAFSLDFLTSEIYTALNTLELIALGSICNFFYVLYKKQQNK